MGPSFEEVPNDQDRLLEVESIAVVRRSHSRRLRLAGGLVAGVALVVCVATWRGRCVPMGDSVRSIVSFVETYPSELANLVERDEDRAAMYEWLEAASAVKKTASSGSSLEAANDAIARAMETAGPEQARQVVDEAMWRSMAKTLARRRSLKEFIVAKRRGLRAPSAESADKAVDLGAGTDGAGGPEPAAGALGSRQGHHGHGHHSHHDSQMQAQTASCVFDALQATNSLAFAAANLNDAIRTCPVAKSAGLYDPNDKSSDKACAIDVTTIFAELNYLASTLSLAANDCAATLVPNVDALCAAGITGLVWAVGNIAASSSLIAASCNTGSDFSTNDVPSEVGSSGAHRGGRRLEEASAPARELLFGGGKPSTGGQCALEVTDILWSLARFALMINAADQGKVGPIGQCPPNGGKKEDGPMYEVLRAFCSFNVGGILMTYARVAEFIQLAVVDCADTMNLGAICGAGVTGLISSAAGATMGGSLASPTCGPLNDPLLDRALKVASRVPDISGDKVTEIIESGVLGRRLAEIEVPTALDFADMTDADLYQRYGSPEMAFKSLGIDITDKEAAFRTHRRPQTPDVTELFGKSDEPSLFGGTCSA